MSKTYINALVTDKGNLNLNPVVRQSLQTFYQRNLYIDSVKDNPIHSILKTTEDECISEAADSNFDFLILTWEGNLFDIYRYHHESIAAINDIDNETNGNWLVSGHLMDQEQNRLLHNDSNSAAWKNSFWLFPITALININKWKELGRPKWGSEGLTINVKQGIPSTECVHDNYTPLTLSPGDSEFLTKVKKGWNFVDASLRANIPVKNLPNNVRAVQNYLYPENDPKLFNDFWTSLYNMPKLTDQYKKVLDSLLPSKHNRRIKDNSWQCFIKNTEHYNPAGYYGVMMDKLAIDTPPNGLMLEIDWNTIDTIMLPSSGFKDFISSMGIGGAKKPIHIIHFDIIGECVQIKKRTIEEWDGKRSTFVPTLINIATQFNKDDPNGVFHMHSMKDLIEAYDHILQFFADEQDLEQSWLKFKTFNHSYIEADMLVNPHNTLKLIKGKGVYLCLSDIAGWRNNLMSYGYRILRNDIINCIQHIRNKGITGIVDYKDPATDLQLWQEFDAAITYLKQDI